MTKWTSDYTVLCQVCEAPCWASYGPVCPRCAPPPSEPSQGRLGAVGAVLAVVVCGALWAAAVYGFSRLLIQPWLPG